MTPHASPLRLSSNFQKESGQWDSPITRTRREYSIVAEKQALKEVRAPALNAAPPSPLLRVLSR
jgi:hypothetical protein